MQTRTDRGVASAQGVPPSPPTPVAPPHPERADARIVARTTRHVLWLVLGLVLLGGALALLLFDWRFALGGAAIFFLYMLLIGAPAWAAWLARDADVAAIEIAREDGSEAEPLPPSDVDVEDHVHATRGSPSAPPD